MLQYIIDFAPPMIGLENEFNTIRLGLTLSKKLNVGDKVYIVDNKLKAVIGEAEVTGVFTGSLEELCNAHASKNHTLLDGTKDSNSHPQELMRTVQKLYGPHIAMPNKKATVVYLKRLT